MQSANAIVFEKPAVAGLISVIIPVENDALGLLDTLKSLAKQTYPHTRVEVLVGNDGDSPAVQEICSRHGVTLLSSPRLIGSYAMRNLLMTRSRGEVLAFIDAQTIASPTWLANGIASLSRYDYVGGAIDVISHPTISISRLLFTYQKAMTFDVYEYMHSFHFASTTNLFVTRKIIEQIGGFDGRLMSSGDLEFGNRAITHYCVKYVYNEDLKVCHYIRSLKQLTLKQRRIARGHHALVQLYPQRFAPFNASVLSLLLRMLVPPIWVLGRKKVRTLSFPEKWGVVGVHYWINAVYSLYRIASFWR